MADERAEALRKLEDRLGEASQRAERLMREAAARSREQQAPPDGKPPPAGWQARDEPGPSSSPGSELDALLSAARSLRDLVPPEVLHRLAEALREVLMAIRALIDHYVERLERQRAEPPEVKDIPIE